MEINKSTYCPFPFNHLHVQATNEVKACCIAHSFDEKLSLENNTLEEVYNSKQLRQLRKDLNNGIKNPVCNVCWEKEEAGVPSGRQEWLGLGNFKEHSKREITHSDSDGYVELAFDSLDIRFSNVCNFGCIMCGPDCSSVINNNKVIRVRDNFVEELKPHLHKLKRVSFAGGEPLAMTEHYELLEFISNNKPDVNIVYSTNGSLLSKKHHNVLDYWKKIQEVTLVISIDGLFEKGEKIRIGLKTQHFIDNIFKIQQFKEENKNLDYTLSYTVGTYNVNDIYEFIDKVYELKLVTRSNQIKFNNFVNFPTHYSIQSLSDDEKHNTKKYLLGPKYELLDPYLQGFVRDTVNFMYNKNIV